MDIPVTGPAQIPATVEVICGTLRGTYDVAKTKILYLSHLGGIREATPTEFERLGGRQATKKWKQSIRVVDSHGQPGKSLGEWLAGTAGTSGEGQRQAFAWLTMGQRGGAWAEAGDGGRGNPQSTSSQMREQFQLQLLDFLSGRIDNPGPGPGSQVSGGEFGPVTLGSHTFDLRKVYTIVREMGGYSATQALSDGWEKVAAGVGMEAVTPLAVHACRSVYEHYLLRAERLEKAREATGIPLPPPPPPRRQASSPSGSGPSLPTGAGTQQKQEPSERQVFADRAPSVSQRAPAPAAPQQPAARRPVPPPPQWGGPSTGRSGAGGGGQDRRVHEDSRPAGGATGNGSKGQYVASAGRNGGGGGYDSGHGDGGGGYDGPGRSNYEGPSRASYDGPSRSGYDGPSRSGYESSGRGGYDSGGRGGYDGGRRGFEGGGRGGYDSGGRGGYDSGGRGGYSGGGRGGYEAEGRGYDSGNSRGGGGGYDTAPAPATAVARYRQDSNSSLERRLAGLEALLQQHAVQPQHRYDNQYEQRSSLLPLDIGDDQLLLAAGLGLQGASGRDGGTVLNPLLLESASLAQVNRQQQPSLHFGGGGLQQRLQLQLAGGGGGRQQQDPREAMLVTVAGGPGGGGLGGRGSMVQAQVDHTSLVSLAGGHASSSGRLLPVALGRGGGGGSGGPEALHPGWLPRGRAGSALQQLQSGRAAALLGLQGDLPDGTVVDDPMISNLLSEYFGSAGVPAAMGLVRTGSGNIGVSGIGGGGGGYKRGQPDGGPGGGGGDHGSGPHKRTAM